jgi:hypothetical protein
VRNHAADISACDAVQTYDVFFQTIFVFVIIELGSRQIIHFNVTRLPSDARVAQQLREAAPLGQLPSTACCECFMGSLHRECLDHINILSRKPLRRLVKDYMQCFDSDRPHEASTSVFQPA